MITIAILEDDPDMADLMGSLISGDGRKVVTFSTAGKFLDSLDKKIPDFLVLDMNLPGISGKDLLRVLRGNPRTSRLPILSVSGSMREISDVVSGLDLGADDYLRKPFDNREFRIRVDSLLARSRRQSAASETAADEEIAVGPLRISLDSRVVILEKRAVNLAPLEFELLIYLLRQRNRVISRHTLLENVWKGDPVMSTRAVDKRVEILRSKLGKFGSHIETVFGIGYVFKL